MMLRALLLAMFATTTCQAGDNIDRMEALARGLTSVYDRGQIVGWATVLIQVRQENNKFPNIWAGRWTASNLNLIAEYDMLDDQLALRSTGGFTIGVAAVPDRVGLETIFPMQALVNNLREAPLAISLRDFTNWRILADDVPVPWGRRPPAGTRLQATAVAVIRSGTTETAFPGQTIHFIHDAEDFALRLRCNLVIQGRPLGLPETQHGDIAITIDVKGPPPSVDLTPGPR